MSHRARRAAWRASVLHACAGRSGFALSRRARRYRCSNEDRHQLPTQFGVRKQLLDDLYVRFIRLAEERIGEAAEHGIVSYISNSSYLTGRSHPEVPIERFQCAEAKALKPVAGIPPFDVARELIRRVQADCAVEIDGNAYSVLWRLIGETVRATVMDGVVRIHPAGRS
jgi:hypothetical protein